MRRPDDLLSVADDLVSANIGKPRQSSLRRAVSTVYYAMFHCLARCCADTLIGSSGADRSKPAWRQVYRALDHGFAKNSCRNQEFIKKFPKDIEDFANSFVSMQGNDIRLITILFRNSLNWKLKVTLLPHER